MKRSNLFVSFLAVACALTGYFLSQPASASIEIQSLSLTVEKAASAREVKDLVTNRGRCVTEGNFPSAVTSGNFPNAVTSGNFPDAVTSGNFPTSGWSLDGGASRTALPAPQIAL